MRLPSGIFNVSYSQDMIVFRTRYHWSALIVFLLLLLSLFFFADAYWLSLISTTAVTIISLQGLNILTGYCGQISLGHSGFMAVGAYSAAILAQRLSIPFLLCIPLAGICAGLVGIIFGLPSLRVKGLYLAIATLAAQFIIIYTIKTPFPDITGGAIALHVPKVNLGFIIMEGERQFYLLIVLLCIIMTFFSKGLTRSQIGRSFVAIRDNDIAAEAMGINLYKSKLLAFFIGCFYAGIAGSIWAGYTGVISPDDFKLTNSIWLVGMLIVGGLGSTLGPFFGGVFISSLNEICLLTGPMIDSAIPQIGAQISAALVDIFFAITLILFLVFEPRGLTHRWEILKESYRLWPFSY